MDRQMTLYLPMLLRFPEFAERVRTSVMPDQLRIFGRGSAHENCVRSLASGVFCSCALLADPALSRTSSDEVRSALLGVASSGLLYLTRTHCSSNGRYACAGGGKWGNEWQSAWWAAKMSLGARLIWPLLDDSHRGGVSRVIAAEADRFINLPARTGLFRDTKAEENAWDAEALAAAIAVLPNHAHVAQWERALCEYAVNSLSAPQDQTSESLVDGRPLRQLAYTVNVHSDYTVENHGPYHFCYVASPLHSLTWCYYALHAAGRRIPEALLHNTRQVWNRIKGTFLDNRFAYICGQDWARYTYGSYFILPFLAMLARLDQDPAAHAMELCRAQRLAEEQSANGDGSFFGSRVTHGRTCGQELKYELDCYANVALTHLLTESMAKPPPPMSPEQLTIEKRQVHCSPEAGLCYANTGDLFASFAWDSLDGPYPLALFVPSGMDDATEWARGNLMAVVETRVDRASTLSQRRMQLTDYGWRVCGRIMYRSRRSTWVYDHDLLVAFIEKERVLVIENRCRARRRMMVRRASGLRFYLANDLFNGFRRRIHSADGVHDLAWAGEDEPRRRRRWACRWERACKSLGWVAPWSLVCNGSWINIDDRLGVICAHGVPNFQIVRSSSRSSGGGSLHCEQIESQPTGMRRCRPDDVILHSRHLVIAGDSARTRDIASRVAEFGIPELRLPVSIV